MAMRATLVTTAVPASPSVKVGRSFTVSGTVTDPDSIQDPIAVGSSATTPATFGDLANPETAGFLGMTKVTVRNEQLHTYYDFVWTPPENFFSAGDKVWIAYMASPTGIPYDDANVLRDVAGPFVALA